MIVKVYAEINDIINKPTLEFDVDIKDYMPEKQDAYVSYICNEKMFFVSTTDDDEYNGRTSMDAIVNDFIEMHTTKNGLDINVANIFIEDLENAIKRIKDVSVTFTDVGEQNG